MHLSPPSIDTNQSGPLVPKSGVPSPSGPHAHPVQGFITPPSHWTRTLCCLNRHTCESWILLGLVSGIYMLMLNFDNTVYFPFFLSFFLFMFSFCLVFSFMSKFFFFFHVFLSG